MNEHRYDHIMDTCIIVTLCTLLNRSGFHIISPDPSKHAKLKEGRVTLVLWRCLTTLHVRFWRRLLLIIIK